MTFRIYAVHDFHNALIRVYGLIKEIYRPRYLGLNAILSILYYIAINEFVLIQQNGVEFTLVNPYLIPPLAVASATTLTIAIYSINRTRRNKAKITGSTLSIFSIISGGIIAGCGCQVPILFNILLIFLSFTDAVSVYAIFSSNVNNITGFLVIINLFVIVYYLNKLSKPMCRLK